MERFHFFWRSASPFSQWHPATFTVDGVTYRCAEHFMMAGKARLFGDEATLARILAASSPVTQKQLGRKVSPFDDTVWRREARAIVRAGNEAKFLQNPHLLDALMAIQGRTLVEAAPNDRIWGIGLAEDDPRAASRSTWLGTNWLGEILTDLREDLIARGVQ